jgi:hypothetical protein
MVSSGEERLGRTAGRHRRNRGGQRRVEEGGSEAGEDAWLASERLRSGRAQHVTVRVLAMLEIYFVSVNYVFVSIKLMCVCVKLLKI